MGNFGRHSFYFFFFCNFGSKFRWKAHNLCPLWKLKFSIEKERERVSLCRSISPPNLRFSVAWLAKSRTYLKWYRIKNSLSIFNIVRRVCLLNSISCSLADNVRYFVAYHFFPLIFFSSYLWNGVWNGMPSQESRYQWNIEYTTHRFTISTVFFCFVVVDAGGTRGWGFSFIQHRNTRNMRKNGAKLIWQSRNGRYFGSILFTNY